jgi:hypothetical protein
MGILDKWLGVTKLEESAVETELAIDHLERTVDGAKEIHESAMLGMLMELESENQGWRSIGTANDSIRDFTTDTHKELSRMAWSAVMTNPIAAREIFYKSVFVAGKGLRCTSQIPEIQKVIDEFWTSTRNKIPYQFPMYINRYNIDGEVFFALFIDKKTGKVTLRDIEPQEITEILFDPDDHATPVYFRRQYTRTKGAKGTTSYIENKDIWYKSVDCIQHKQLEKEVQLPDNAEMAAGDDPNVDVFVFHFKNSLLTNRRRGLSTLTNHLPWLREYKDILRARTGINKARSSFFLDITMKGATKLQIQEEARKHVSPPRPNTCVVHDDNVTYQFLTPNVQGADVQSDLTEIKNMSAVGSMLPPDLLGESGKSNYQNSGRSKFPFVRSMEFQQELWEFALKYGIMWVVIWSATEYGELPDSFKVAKKMSISSLALTQEGELYDTKTMAIVDKKTEKIVKNHIRNIFEAAAMPGADITSQPMGQPPMPGMPPRPPMPMPGGDPAKAEAMMDDYVVITMSEEVDAVDLVDVHFPRIDTENLGDMAMAFQAFDAMKIVSKQTLAKLAGFDYAKEKELVAQETAEAMKTMEDQQAKLAATPGLAGSNPMGVGPPGMPGAPPGGPPMPDGQNNEAGNIQMVLGDILNRPGRSKKRGPVMESRLMVAHKLVEAFLLEEE